MAKVSRSRSMTRRGGAKSKSVKKTKSKKAPMKANEAYCVVCKKRVTVKDLKPHPVKNAKRKMKMMTAKCPNGNHNVYKIVGN